MVGPMLRFLAVTLLFAVTILFALSLPAAQFPQARISNGTVDAVLYLPDGDRGYYRGTRFDWSGVIASIKYKGHEFVGQWFDKYDPKLHDAILGPVEEFRTGDSALGYDEAKPGDSFIRIGVGGVERANAGPYQTFETYNIVNPGKWIIRPRRDSIDFVHELKDGSGYAYVYKKTVRLPGSKPEMVIEHELQNTGKKVIDTTQYNHNFFVFDGMFSGPGTEVKFAFEPQAKRDLKGLVEIKGKDLVYLKQMDKGESVFTEIEGFDESADDYDLRIEHAKAGTGVRINGDQPIAKLNFWSIRTTVCPEPFVAMRLEPGQKKKWEYTYTFYTLDEATK